MSAAGDFQHKIHPLHQQRWSPRAFADRPVEPEKLATLLEAARWAPSCYNEQPWSFILGTRQETPETYEKILSCLVEANQAWAKSAPVLLLSVAQLTFKKNQKPNRHAYHDVGLAAGNFVTEATHAGLYVHQMGGFDVEKARETFQIPEGYDPVAAIAVGYLGDPSQLPEKYQSIEQAPRTRKPLQDFVFTESWGKGEFKVKT